MKFLADRNLGKLAKWLRILGYDTVYDRENMGRALLDRGFREGRVVLTRRKDMARRNYRGRMLVIVSDDLPGQLQEVTAAFGLTPDRSAYFTRCILCNEILLDMPREEAKPFVPPSIYATHKHFGRCRSCGRFYWPGTHLSGVGPRQHPEK